MQTYSNYFRDTNLNGYPGASIYVYFAGTTTLAELIPTSGKIESPGMMPNPFSTDSSGYFTFTVNDGAYDIKMTAPGVPTTTVSGWTANNLANTFYTPTGATTPVSLQNYLINHGVCPESFGAIGDGITDDTLAIRAAITMAGSGGFIRFKYGKTYLISGELRLLQNQTVIGYGAAIKRANMVSTTTTGPIATGTSSTDIPVTSSAAFRVGMTVNVYDGTAGWKGDSPTGIDASNHQVLAIKGNVITVATAFTTSFSAGATLFTSHACMTSVLSGVPGPRVMGLEFNGNRANQTGPCRWNLHQEMYLTGNSSLARDLYMHDCQSEGIEFGGNSTSVENCYIENAGGNGIHFSGVNGGQAINCWVNGTNLLGTDPGHADGAILFSNSTSDCVVTGNYINNCISGIASIDSDDNSSVVITGNITRNCTYAAVEGEFASGQKGGKVVVNGNRFYNSKLVKISYAPGSFSAGNGPYSWLVTNNDFEETGLWMQGAINCSVNGNNFISTGTTLTQIYVNDCRNVLVSANHIRGGQQGIATQGSNSRDIKIVGNQCINQYNWGIYAGTALTSMGVFIDSNTVIFESGASSNGSYQGIRAQNGVFVLNNTLDCTVTSTLPAIRCGLGGASQNGTIVQGNVVRSTGMLGSIGMDSGSINNLVSYNFVQQAVSNLGTNTLTGNQTIY